MFVEQPAHLGRLFLLSVLVWGSVALVVLAGLDLTLPHGHVRLVGAEPTCKTTVPIGAFDPLAAREARAAMFAPSRCGARATGSDTNELLHAYLEGAELDSAPRQPPPAVDAALRTRGAALYKSHCATCHGQTGNGAGPDACALETPPAVHQKGVFELRTTEHEALPTDEDIFRTITRGVHGTAMPPWFSLSEYDRWALVAHVKSLSTQFEEDVAPPPIVSGQPPEATPQRIAAGRELFAKGGCASCHGSTGEGNGPAAQSLAVKPRNFTRGRFHRGSSAADIHETLVTGLDGTPMASFAKVMSADDLWNVSLFVHSLAPPMTDRGGVRCPDSARPLDTQELFGVRNLLHTMNEH